MNKYDALFVRAVKSNSPEFRVKRLYERFYYHVYSAVHLVGILNRIVENHGLMSSVNWIDGLNPTNGWKYGIDENTSYHERCIAVMSSYIRLSRIDSFDNYPLPAKFKDK